MMVYGDLKFEAELSSVVARVREQAGKATVLTLEELRTLLIQSGQLEQGVEDYWAEHGESERRNQGRIADTLKRRLQTLAKGITSDAAAIFYAVWENGGNECSIEVGNSRCYLERLKRKLAAIQTADDPKLIIKVPEGFAFYSLFPEQYCVSASKWAADHSGAFPRRVLLIGIRSIGTTLSAIVEATLRSLGWEVQRLTVRPKGHPFSRKLDIKAPDAHEINCALIVDEGPGISGSSMAAVAEWLGTAGVSEVAFFPGHENEPGPSASAEIRRWWQKTPRYFTPLEELRWGGKSLTDELGRRFAPEQASKINDLGAGKWREWSFANAEEWPGVCTTLERSKFRLAGAKPVLCKFEGLGCMVGEKETQIEAALSKMKMLAAEGFTPPPIGVVSGFVGTQWINGERMSRGDAKKRKVLQCLSRYIVAASGRPLTLGEARLARERLREMLYWNTKEALGERMAERVGHFTEASRGEEPPLTYGDGRMAPHEWVRTVEGTIFKMDCAGHDSDHTLIGKQSVLWDFAGAVVEWDLGPAQVEFLLTSLGSKAIKPETLTFYLTAYAAFRIGTMSLARSQTGEKEPERRRVDREMDYYKKKLLSFV